jgi:hypothetical protein
VNFSFTQLNLNANYLSIYEILKIYFMIRVVLFILMLPTLMYAQTEPQLLAAAQTFPVMPRGTADLIPFVGGFPTFSSGTPFNDLEFTLFDTDYMDGENSGADNFMPVDPSDTYPGENKVKILRCILNTDLDKAYQSGKTDRIILGTFEHPNPFFMKGADALDNDYAVILHFDYDNAFIQLKGQASDYRLRFYDSATNGVMTTGWYLFYTKGNNLDLIAFIFPCNVIEPAVSGNLPQDPNPLCNIDSNLSLANANQFKFATPINTNPVITLGGITQYGSSGKEILGGSTKDDEGNLYLVGLTDGNLDGQTDASNEIFVTKINTQGQVQWVYELAMKEGSFLKDAVTDSAFVYICGRTLGNLPGFTNAGKWDGIILKLDKNTGALVASNQWGNAGIDGYGCIAQDDNGNVFVSAQGSPTGSSGTDDKYLVAKHKKSDLSNVWRMIDATTQTGFAASAEAWGGITYVPKSIPGDGRLIVAGWVISAGGANAFTSVYENLNSTTPSRPYSNIIASPGSRAEWVLDNAVDSAGNIYFVGFTSGNLQGTHQGEGDAYIVKYNSSMQNPIFKQFGTNKGDLARKIEVDKDGTIYVAGYTYGNYSGTNADATQNSGDVFIQKFDANLNFLEKKQFGTPHEDRAMIHLKGDDLFITGMTEGTMVGSSKGSFDTYIAVVNKHTLNYIPLSTSNQQQTAGISLYPNPAQQSFRISTQYSGNINYQISDINSGVTNNNDVIDIFNLQHGLYFVFVQAKDAKQVFKLVKE